MKSDVIAKNGKLKKNDETKNSKKPMIIGLIFVIICIFMAFPLIIFPNKTLGEFKEALKAKDFDKASFIYYDASSEGNLRERMNEFILDSTDSMFADYKNGNKEFSELEAYMQSTTDEFKLDGFAIYNSMLEELRASYKKYTEGIELEKSEQLGNAILSYTDVAENDPQYLTVKQKISILKDEYKKYLSETLPVLKDNRDFENALSEIAIAQEIFGETS